MASLWPLALTESDAEVRFNLVSSPSFRVYYLLPKGLEEKGRKGREMGPNLNEANCTQKSSGLKMRKMGCKGLGAPHTAHGSKLETWKLDFARRPYSSEGGKKGLWEGKMKEFLSD